MSRRDDIARIGEQAAYVAADPSHPFHGRDALARTVGFLHHFGPLTDVELHGIESEWRRLYPPSSVYSDAELAGLLDLLDRLNPPPLPLPPDDDLAGLLAMLAADADPLPLLAPDGNLARLLDQLDANREAR